MPYRNLLLYVLVFFSFQSFSQDLKPKQKDGKWGFRQYGKILFDYQFEEIEKFNYNNYLVKKDGKWGVLNSLGEKIIPCENDSLSHDKSLRGFMAQQDGAVGFYDMDGKMIIPCVYEEFQLIDKLVLGKKNKWGAMDLKGNNIVPFEYDELKYEIINETFLIRKKKKWGALDKNGVQLLATKYEAIDHYGEKGSLIKQDDVWGMLINDEFKSDKERLVFHYPEISPLFQECPEETTLKAKRECADRAMLMNIYRNLRYPAKAREDGIQGTVFINFLISPKGKVAEVTCIKSIGGGCDEESIRVVKEMPDWIPGEQDGDKVWTRYTMPLRFRLE